MIVGTTPKGPEKLAGRFVNGQVVNAGYSPSHKTILIKLPVLVSVRPEPVAAVVVPFIRKADGNPIFMKGPQFLGQSILQLSIPFPRQELHNRLSPRDKLRPVAPHAVDGVSLRNLFGIPAVPGIFCQPDFLLSGLPGKGWQGWARWLGNAHDFSWKVELL